MDSENSQPTSKPVSGGWRSAQVYTMSLVCLGAGLALGYVARGSQAAAPSQVKQAAATQPVGAPQATVPQSPPVPTLEQMKQMGDKAASSQLEKIKKNPNDFEALNNAGKVYRATHQFEKAASFYERALKIQPKNAAVRTDLASCLYYSGDVDGALAQLNKALSYDPKFFGALLNEGIIKLRAKNDVQGAVNSWQKILQTDKDPEHQEVARKLIAAAKQKSSVDSEKNPTS